MTPSSELDLFTAALGFTDPGERSAFLRRACDGNPALLDRVERLLRMHDSDASVLDQSTSQLLNDIPPTTNLLPPAGLRFHPRLRSEGVGSVIAGRYELTELIGQGGMGAVFLARQRQPVTREVAVKLIRVGMESGEQLARFEAERQTLAVMDHPNIARVYDGGTSPSGQPYFVMEVVRGSPLIRFCDTRQLPLRGRLELFIALCRAVEHAHQKGVIHRDLKPSNVLVADVDGRPTPKVIDFGVAKAVDRFRGQSAAETGDVVGTPEYMSPEQADPSAVVDTRSDVFALGVILFELLVGSTPLGSARDSGGSVDELLRRVRETVVPRPSTVLSESADRRAIAERRAIAPAELTSALRTELDWVLTKALQKNPAERYQSAVELAADVDRYLTGDAVLAVPQSVGYRVRKVVAKHRRPVLALSLLFVSLVAGVVGSTWGWVAAADKQREAEEARREEATQRAAADDARRDAELALADAIAAYRGSTDDSVRYLIGSKADLGPFERAYLESTAERWQAFADRQGAARSALAGEAHYHIAHLWARLGRAGEAVSEYQRARDILIEVVERAPDETESRTLLALARQGLGHQFHNLGRYEEALVEYEAAVTHHTRLAAARPNDLPQADRLARARLGRANLLNTLGRWDAAEADYRAALADALRGGDDPFARQTAANAHSNLGIQHEQRGNAAAARSEQRAARDVLVGLVREYPDRADYRQELAIAHSHCGRYERHARDFAAAVRECTAARDLQQALVSQFPVVHEYQNELALTRLTVADIAVQTDRPADAEKDYTAARDVQVKLVERFPDMPQYRLQLAGTRLTFGRFHLGRRAWDAARVELTAARELLEQLAANAPTDVGCQVDLGSVYVSLSFLDRDGGTLAECLNWFEQAVRTLTPLLDRGSFTDRIKRELFAAHRGRAVALVRLKQAEDSLPDWDKALDFCPTERQPELRYLRTSALFQAGRPQQAVDEAADLLKLANWTGDQFFHFASLYAAAGTLIPAMSNEYADRAVEVLQRALKAGFNDVMKLKEDRDFALLRERDDFKALLASLPAKATPARGK